MLRLFQTEDIRLGQTVLDTTRFQMDDENELGKTTRFFGYLDLFLSIIMFVFFWADSRVASIATGGAQLVAILGSVALIDSTNPKRDPELAYTMIVFWMISIGPICIMIYSTTSDFPALGIMLVFRLVLTCLVCPFLYRLRPGATSFVQTSRRRSSSRSRAVSIHAILRATDASCESCINPNPSAPPRQLVPNENACISSRDESDLRCLIREDDELPTAPPLPELFLNPAVTPDNHEVESDQFPLTPLSNREFGVRRSGSLSSLPPPYHTVVRLDELRRIQYERRPETPPPTYGEVRKAMLKSIGGKSLP